MLVHRLWIKPISFGSPEQALALGAIWYVKQEAERQTAAVLRQADAERKKALSEQAVKLALDQAEQAREELQRKLRQPGGVFELLKSRIAPQAFAIYFIDMPNSSGAGRSIDEILMAGGKPIGVKGTGPRASARLREVTGGQTEAERMFQELTPGGKDVTPPGYPGTLIELPNGRGTIGYRPASKSGPATIDVKRDQGSGTVSLWILVRSRLSLSAKKSR